MIGRVIPFEERRVRIVGVLPPNFIAPSLAARNADLILATESPFIGPVTEAREATMAPIARLKPNVTLAAAQSEIDALVANVVKDHPDLKRRPWDSSK